MKTRRQATTQKANKNFRLELWRTYTKIEKVKSGATLFYGISEQEAYATAVGIIIGLREKYARPQVLVFRVNPDGTEKLLRIQR